jgi:hypothetical protein
MKRTTAIPIPVADASDVNPIPSPKPTFHKQPAKAEFPTGGLFSSGVIKFNINNKAMREKASEAFVNNSAFKSDANALDCFLLSINTTASFEGGFDAVNTYDKAGVSLGFLQFARPEGGAGQLLNLAGRSDLAAVVQTRFGTIDPHASPSAVKARFDEVLLQEIVNAIASPAGIEAQLAMAVNKNLGGQFYFDKAYATFLQLKLTDPLSCNLLFDCAVNLGVGCLSKFKSNTNGSDGDWLQTAIQVHKRPERLKGWKKILRDNFE